MKRNTMLLVAAGGVVAALALSGKLEGLLGGGFLGEGAAGTGETKKEVTITEEGGVQGDGINLPADNFAGFPTDTYNVTNLFAPPPAANVAKGCGSADLASANRYVLTSIGSPMPSGPNPDYTTAGDTGFQAFEQKYGLGGAGSNALGTKKVTNPVVLGTEIGVGTALFGPFGGILTALRAGLGQNVGGGGFSAITGGLGLRDTPSTNIVKSLSMGAGLPVVTPIAKKDAITVETSGGYNFASQDVANFAAGSMAVNAPLVGTGVVVPVGTSGATGIMTTIANKGGGGYAVVSGGQITASGSSGAPAGAVAATAGANMSSAAAFSASIAASKKSGSYYRGR